MFEFKPNHNFTVLKLLYLPLRARGEALRMLLRHTKTRYVNEIVSFSDWPALKSQMPNKQLPVLQLGSGGKLLANSMDIGLHVANIMGPPLVPTNEADAESALDCWRELDGTSVPYIGDIWSETTPWDARIGGVNPLLNFLPQDKALPLIPSYLAGTRPWLETLRARVQRKKPEGGAFMGGTKPHHGEFASFAICNNILTLGGASALDAGGPELLRWYASMSELPAVAEHLESRPQAGTGSVGQPGSLIYEHADPSAVVAKYTVESSGHHWHDARVVGLSDGSPSTDGVDGMYAGGWDRAQERPHGRGVMKWDNGITYDGDWRDGVYDGYGKKSYSRGGGYAGMWRTGKRQGQGVSFYDGKWGYEQWEGSFVDDKPHGEGVMVVREGGARVPFAF